MARTSPPGSRPRLERQTCAELGLERVGQGRDCAGAAQIPDGLIVSGRRELIAANLVAERWAVRDVVELHEHTEPLVLRQRKIFRDARVQVDERKTAGVVDAARHLAGAKADALVVSRSAQK